MIRHVTFCSNYLCLIFKLHVKCLACCLAHSGHLGMLAISVDLRIIISSIYIHYNPDRKF